MSNKPKIDPVCLVHGKRMSEHVCLYCQLCYKSLTPEECHVLPDGTKEYVCNECAEKERIAMEKQYQEAKKLLIRACYRYYVKAEPIMSDYDYDHKVYDFKKLESNRGYADEDSPTQIIWGSRDEQYPEWAKI